MISYQQACEIVQSAQKFGICLGLERMEQLLSELGNPEKKLQAIHVAGTNGKGSTVTYLSAIAMAAGYTVGTYTSPAITKINDKICYNREEISDNDFASIIEKLLPIMNKMKQMPFGEPTEFELLTAMAFYYFAEYQKPDIVLIETGLGGRLDSTNVITPLLSIITSIGHDHCELLGETIEEITTEKAGIIKGNCPVISGCKQAEARTVLNEHSKQKSAALYQLNEDFNCSHAKDHFHFQWGHSHYENLTTAMIGKHQQENAALAIAALHCLPQFSISEAEIRQGLLTAKIANRIEIVAEKPTIIFDGGHNREGIEALAGTLTSTYSEQKIVILFCAMKDKEIDKMLEPLSLLAEQIVLTTFDDQRAMNPKEIYQMLQLENSQVIENCFDAYQYCKQQLSEEDVFVVTGSLYFLNHFRSHYLRKISL